MRVFRKESGSKGFTLIEIMVVMILIAFAGSLVFINVGKSGHMKQSRIFARKMVGLCKKARLRSVNEGMPACVKISPDTRQCWISFKDEDFKKSDDLVKNNGESDYLDNKGKGVAIPENMLIKGVGIKKSDDDISYLCFYPDGSSGGGELTLLVEGEFEFTFRVDMLTGNIHRKLEIGN